MEFKLYKQLYTNNLPEKKLKRYRKRIKEGRPSISLFLITVPFSGDGILEIYPYTALLQKHFKEEDKPLYILGLADSYEAAVEVTVRLIDDMYRETGSFSVQTFVCSMAEGR